MFKRVEQICLKGWVGFWIGFFLFSVASCGFHLRGNSPQISDKPTYLIFSNISFDFQQTFTSMIAKQVKLVDRAEQADVILNFENETWRKQIVSLDTRGHPLEFSIYYELNYFVQFKSQEPQRQRVELAQDFAFSSARLLSAEQEETSVRQQLQKRAAFRVLAAINQLNQ